VEDLETWKIIAKNEHYFLTHLKTKEDYIKEVSRLKLVENNFQTSIRIDASHSTKL
jgi:hypothetical protein